jgi:NADPH:quinone reductase-like Zn-dependent oxidoreductase
MKAVVYERYGPPEVLMLCDIKKPTPKENEILVKIYSTSVTAGDWRMRKADPFLVRLFAGLFKPTRLNVLGFELAGVVEEAGSKVSSFRKGDAVFASCGFRFGAYAEYKCLPEDELVAIKPSNMSFDEAATVPIGGLTALRLLRQAGLRAGDRILVYGASGSVGTFAVQLAKHFGAVVTAVCSSPNAALVTSLGASSVIDYKTQDLRNMQDSFDVVLDAVGKMSKADRKRLLKRDGKFTTVAGSPKANKDDLITLKNIIEAGHLKSVIDRTYTLEQIREAHAYVEGFHKKGNVVVKIV